MALISKTSNRADQKPVKPSPNVAGLRQPSPATWRTIFNEIEMVDVPDDFLSSRPDNGPAQVRE